MQMRKIIKLCYNDSLQPPRRFQIRACPVVRADQGVRAVRCRPLLSLEVQGVPWALVLRHRPCPVDRRGQGSPVVLEVPGGLNMDIVQEK